MTKDQERAILLALAERWWAHVEPEVQKLMPPETVTPIASLLKAAYISGCEATLDVMFPRQEKQCQSTH